MDHSKKILQFIDSLDPGGAESLVIDLSLGLQDMGMEVTVGHFGNPWLAERCQSEGIPQAIILGHRWYKSSVTLPWFIYTFSKYLRSNQFSAVHAHLYGATVAAAIAGRFSGIPVVGTLHDAYTLTERPSRIRLLQLAAFCGARLVSVAQYMEELFTTMARFNSAAWQTIPNGVDTERYYPRPRGNDLAADRTTAGLPTDGPLIGSVGRLVPLKRFNELIEAFSRSEVSAHLIIIGDGPERPALERLIQQREITEKVHLLGQRSDISSLLPLLDLFVLWSETEGLSCSIAEAMSCGMPSLVSDVGGNRELIEQGTSGILVPADATDQLVAYLQTLCNDEDLRNQLGNAARRRIEHNYSHTAMINNYAGLLSKPT